MSRTADSSPALVDSSVSREADHPPTRARSRKHRAILAWAIVGCVLMGSSGLVRAIQERRFKVEKGYLEVCPFPVNSLPTELGDWRMIPGGEKTLDSLTTRITGATDHVMRLYVDELTGVSLSVLILFGPAEPVVPHTPQVCYPASGYTATEEPSVRTIKGPNGQTYPFRAGVFAKSGGRAMLREVSYHSFRLEGQWSPDIAAGRRFPRKNPGIFKVQIQRKIADGERRERDDPIEQFIARLLPEIDRRIDEAQTGTSSIKAKNSSDSVDPAPARPAR